MHTPWADRPAVIATRSPDSAIWYSRARVAQSSSSFLRLVQSSVSVSCARWNSSATAPTPSKPPGCGRRPVATSLANFVTGTIGRADLDGAAANQSFITGASLPIGVAVTPPSTIADLTASVEALGLPRGIERSLLTRLDGAQRNLDAGDLAGACDKLTSFANQVSAQNGKEIGAADAADLIEEAAAVRESLDCGAP